MAPPVFVINLPASTARRARITRALDQAGIAHAVVSAIDGRDWSGAESALAQQPLPHLGRPLSRGEIGCLLSHLSVLERIVRDGLPIACVLEDDAAIADDLRQVLDTIESVGGDWDVLLLGHHSARHAPAHGAETCFVRRRLTTRRTIARVAEFAMGAYGYVVTQRGAERLLAFARPFRMPMDWVTGHAPAAGIRLSAVTPPCVTPNGALDLGTTIDERPHGPPPAAFRSSLHAFAGRLWLLARKAGLGTDGYAKRY